MQTNAFWGVIMYLLSMLGCNESRNYPMPPPPPPAIEEIEISSKYEDDYQKSLQQWDMDKMDHNNSYEYTLSFESAEGRFKYFTIVTVQNGVITQRKFAFIKLSYDANKVSTDTTQSWTENQAEIGSHTDGFPAKTMDEIYKDCANIYLKGRGQGLEDEIIFELKENRITICGYWPEGCADDCFEGVDIESFKWLE